MTLPIEQKNWKIDILRILIEKETIRKIIKRGLYLELCISISSMKFYKL